MAFSNEPLSPPEADDFQRMGLRRMEFRPPVIRRAIIRSAQPLVLMHLRSPSAEVERLLVNVMLSGYRVLDPRRREDSNQRVMLGRIHPQLVEEAVYLAQAKPAGAAAAGLTSAGVAAAGGISIGGIAIGDVTTGTTLGSAFSDDDDSPLPSEFSPIAERDWLESAEATLGANQGLLSSGLMSSGFAPPSNTSERFLEVTGSAAWAETLTGSDLMVRPTYQRIYRAIRRRLVRASVVPLISGAMLAASILLVLTWRTTVWIRSNGERQASVEVAESILSPAEVARIAAAALVPAPEKTAASVATASAQAAVVQAPVVAQASATNQASASTPASTGLDPLANDTPTAASKTGSVEPKNAGTVAAAALSAGPNMSSTPGVDLASAVVPMPVPVQPLTPLAVHPSDNLPESALAPEISRTPATKIDAEMKPSIADVASAAAAASPSKSADDERMGLELLGLADPAGATSGPAMAIAEVKKLPPLPEENLLGSARLRVEAAARAIRVADGGSPLAGRAAAASGVATFRAVAGESTAGSAERYVATLLAGQTAALAGLPGEANRAIVDLTLTFDLDRDGAMMRLTRWMAADVAAVGELRAVGTWVDGQVRASMLAGELSLAGDLVAVMQEVGLKHRDDALKSDAKLWRDVLVISQRYADAAARVEAAKETNNASPEDRGLAGRYWAQVCRDWHRALPHFAACSTSKLTKLAGIELLGGQMIDGEDADILADGYLAEAKRAKGWLGESFALHSHEVLTLAAANSDRLVAMELNRKASLVKVDYPWAFVAADDRVAASGGEKQGDGAGVTSSDPATKPATGQATPADGASSLMTIPERGAAQMLGRLRIGGQDAAVLIRYQAGMPVTLNVVEQMIVGLENAGGMPGEEAAARTVELNFVGSLSVDGPKTVTFHLAGSGFGGSQSLSINGRALPIDPPGATRSPKRFEVDLMRGEYLVRWTATLVDGDQLSLRAVDESSGNLVPIFAPPASIANHPGALPTRLRVDLLAAE